jgi:hypothetical protein
MGSSVLRRYQPPPPNPKRRPLSPKVPKRWFTTVL